MELPVLDNEFLSLFLPDNSEFTTEEIIDDYKFYIFIIMKLSVDALIQEQINNEFQINLEKRNFKSFFNERINTVLEINNLYQTTQNKMDNIKYILEKNKTIVEENKELFSSDKIIKELDVLNTNIQSNKSLSVKNSAIIDLISIPTYMINCFKNNCLTIYLEYFDYVKNIHLDANEENFKIIKIIKNGVEKVHTAICNLLTKMLEHNNQNLNDFNYEEINDVLNLQINKIFQNNFPYDYDNNKFIFKKLNVIIHQFKLFYNFLQIDTQSNKKIDEFFEFTKSKIYQIKNIIKENNYEININNSIADVSINYILENYLIPILKNYYFINSNNYSFENFIKRKNKIINLLNDLFAYDNNQIFLNNLFKNSIEEIIEILIEKYYLYLEYLFNLNINSINKYLSGFKDIKKLLSTTTQIESIPNNKEIQNILKFEILIIINNNLSEIYNTIVTENPNLLRNSNLNLIPIKDKNNILLKFNEHFENIFSQIQNFFYDNLFLIKYESFAVEIDLFKSQLNLLILDLNRSLYSVLGLLKYWENIVYPEKKKQWDNFLSPNLELEIDLEKLENKE